MQSMWPHKTFPAPARPSAFVCALLGELETWSERVFKFTKSDADLVVHCGCTDEELLRYTEDGGLYCTSHMYLATRLDEGLEDEARAQCTSPLESVGFRNTFEVPAGASQNDYKGVGSIPGSCIPPTGIPDISGHADDHEDLVRCPASSPGSPDISSIVRSTSRPSTRAPPNKDSDGVPEERICRPLA